MVHMLKSAVIYILANAVGLLVASLLLGDGFTLSVSGFIVATLLLSAVEAVTAPLIDKIAEKNLPAMKGGVALVTTFVGLGITGWLVGGMHISGISNWLLATLLVWIGALIASAILPMFLDKKKIAKQK